MKIALSGFLSVSFLKFYIWLSLLSSKNVENNSIEFLDWPGEEIFCGEQ